LLGIIQKRQCDPILAKDIPEDIGRNLGVVFIVKVWLSESMPFYPYNMKKTCKSSSSELL
jgi:hypothetical protein